MASSDATTAFRDAVEQPAGVDLIGAALAVGLIPSPDLDLAAARTECDGFIAAVAEEVQRAAGDPLAALNRALFARRGLHGNTADYDDPRNCCLHEVLARRTGIPITLSIVYIACGRAAGLELEGVGFPLHFLVRSGRAPAAYRYIDPFNAGQELSRAQLALILQRQGGAAERQLDLFLAAITPRQILTRLVNNLKIMYRNRSNYALARAAVELLLTLAPWSLDEVRDRGLLSLYLGDLATAEADLSTYVDRAPDAPDAERLRERLRELRGREH